ncbi:hypothetical protein SAMN04244560_00298 [Thermoanaerobacter thermohydrosulfuricus]|uniref:Uncharacterized protein n=1 Tax=Thermoanaerobacter thermohydrosulfuricus TaxID=1516 RepID=A0A1G7IPZ0_THETY|nr:hypothetical protein [Thermoanaerobacter thermohydrosulfuricus]SDF14614.1 hypothetical protein SAMN04244560_00298 [Thermoanaerobacter thermohydrosulfuricus]
MNNIIFNKIIGMLLQEIKLASEAKAQAETQSAANYWSGYYSGLKKISAPHSSDFSQELGAALFWYIAYDIIYAKARS